MHALINYHGGSARLQGGTARGYYGGYYYITSRLTPRLRPVTGIFRPTQITANKAADAKAAHYYVKLHAV